ncbi:twin-arginine translocase TatA/TatE family subunit [Serratia symbiotica]|uniref:Sec-independent protein translocase protein TatA n=1 Tax=Serratia symbiotica TaxID=138074 RepID=A0A068Z717_9GAMM|nr:twin-arginine translocase TatA/TatE family subunit [Serratia symbiotica]MBF1994727.1 twin-arginine translocase TatA/TatE family subunit [Serratia symbiotica]MBQ0955495.1 twin-arginine translocase TatA/TatE family subunit [Serratia symbiotica]QLH61800.1 twin-arginine translocase TatA/TatE family subunit [Serratia symbiotica]QTP15776.1 twin-arginine translocase TatA/TatE family subunit [Serratia symbiotica]CDS56720.1 TatABCE protein translocation system subunit [Serratia symbiotica]
MGSISITQLLVIAVIVVLLFGTKKLRTLGSDLGASIKDFKKAIGDETPPPTQTAEKSSLDDADFTAKPITDKPPEVKTENPQKKEQV